MYKVAVVGSYNKGLTITTDRLPAWGETLEGKNFTPSHGGKGSNQAVAAKRLGAEVDFIGAAGDDEFGDQGYKMLKNEGIDVSGMQIINNKNTGVGIIFLDENGENCILIDKGANQYITEEHVENFSYSIEQADVLIVQLEVPIEAVKRAMQIAKDKGTLVIFNPAPAAEEAKQLIQYADVINPNETELLILNGLDPNETLSEERCIDLARRLEKEGPTDVIVTRGEKGAIHVTEDGADIISAPSVVAKDSTGAGDAFTGALAYSLSGNHTVRESLQVAIAAGSYCVTKYNVLDGLTNYPALKKFMEEGNEKNILES